MRHPFSLRIHTTNAQVFLAKPRRTIPHAEKGPSNGIGLFNLPFSTTQEDLNRLFAAHAGWSHVKMVHRRDTGDFRGYAFAYFDTVEHATKAKESLAGLTLGANKVHVKFSNRSAEEAAPSAPPQGPAGAGAEAAAEATQAAAQNAAWAQAALYASQGAVGAEAAFGVPPTACAGAGAAFYAPPTTFIGANAAPFYALPNPAPSGLDAAFYMPQTPPGLAVYL